MVLLVYSHRHHRYHHHQHNRSNKKLGALIGDRKTLLQPPMNSVDSKSTSFDLLFSTDSNNAEITNPELRFGSNLVVGFVVFFI